MARAQDLEQRRSAAVFGAVVLALVVIAPLPARAAVAGRFPVGERVQRELKVKAQRRGTVRVLVQLDAPRATASATPQAAVGSSPSAETAAAARAADVARAAAIQSAGEGLARSLGGTGMRVMRSFRTIPFVALEVTPEALDRLEASPLALAIAEDRLESAFLEESRPLVQADQAAAAGFDGAGWNVAVIDTGVDASHPFLAGKVVSEACYSASQSCPNGSTSQEGPGAGAPCDFASNACLHGTHVAGIAAGRGDDLNGIASGAGIISIQVFSRFEGEDCEDDIEDPCAKTFTSDTLAALERVYELRNTYQIAAANLSLGGGRYVSQAVCDADDTARKAAVDNLRAAGIATVAAAGNDGFTNALASPGCLSSAISVGATMLADQVALFSNSAPFLDLLAPGVSILSSIPGGFARISGTSQATPHVAGAFAILRQRSPASSVDAILNALKNTGLLLLDGASGITTPRIRIYDALLTLGPLPGRPSGLQITPDGKRTLISKDVGSERWAITLNADDGTVTGNVFTTGDEPQFVWCDRTGDDGNPDPNAVQIMFSCSGAVRCPAGSCSIEQWSSIGAVTLPGSFFQPPLLSASIGSSPSLPGAAATEGARASASGAATSPDSAPTGVDAVAQARESGLQVTPDQKRTLISKDLAGQRWAITRNLDDETVTGNVYPTDGSPPTFVWCQRVDGANPADEMDYACSGAGVCSAAPCDASAWAFIADVSLPAEFFEP